MQKHASRECLVKDMTSGFIVFLIALPLCVGISVASGAPPTAGMITAMVGGLLGAFLSGSYLTISGPAAGLIVIVWACVDELGAGSMMAGYQKMLACTVLAGGIQLVLGLLRAGSMALMFPATVVHAMLAAIGVMITTKQSYVLLGITPHTKTFLGLIWQLPQSLSEANGDIALIGLTCLGLLLILTFLTKYFAVLKKIPHPLLAVLFGMSLGFFMDLEHEHTIYNWMGHFKVGPTDLLSVPSSFFSVFYFPDFSDIISFSHIKHAMIIAFVASTESLLSTCAIDRIDPLHRRSALNKELAGKGLCNMVAGLLGGLPMIAEIVRSSANVAHGAKSQASNFFHGLFLMLFLMIVPQYLHLIPLTSLAAVLVFVGYQLCKPSHFFHAREKGKDQGFVFIATVLAILMTDILLGVLIGAALEFVWLVSRYGKLDVFTLRLTHKDLTSDHKTLTITSPLMFTNFLSLKPTLDALVRGTLTLDLRSAHTVDHTAMEHLTYYKKQLSAKGCDLNLNFSEHHLQVADHPQACRYIPKHLKSHLL